jgi:hypothetical protein
MAFYKNEPVTGFPFGLVHKETGAVITTGTVTIYITLDGGVQFQASYTPIHEGNGQWSANFTANEMNADMVGIMVTHTNAIPQHFSIRTEIRVDDTTITTITATSTGSTITGQFEYYGSMSGAINYFSHRLNTTIWDQAVYNDREAALIQATRLIDKLNYGGDVAESDQNLQFPRNDDTTIPPEVEYATYEISIALLDGVDLDQESQTIGVMSETYSGARTTYDGDYVNDHLRAGIPSIEAWDYLKPFLRDPKQLRVSRVS